MDKPYGLFTTEGLYAEAQKILNHAAQDIRRAITSLEKERTYFERTRKPGLRIVYPQD